MTSFIKSAISLHKAYKSCSIIITSRDYYLDKYITRDFKDSIAVFSLLGFSNESVNEYLAKRLSKQRVKDAQKHLSNFDITDQNRHTPLYLSLICDLVDREEYNETPLPDIVESRYYYSELKLDNLIYRLLQREIGKQSLGITCDDYFELIVEISVRHQREISKKDLNEYIEICFPSIESTSRLDSGKYTQFYISPFLSHERGKDTFKVKYDFVELWTKVRFMLSHFERGVLDEDLKRLLIEIHDGSSVLLEEIIEMKDISQIDFIKHGNYLLKKLVDECKSQLDFIRWVDDLIRHSKDECKETNKLKDEYEEINKFIDEREEVNKLKDDKKEAEKKLVLKQKAISGLLYFILSDKNRNTKSDYSNALVKLFGSKKLNHLCIFGKFFPLDFQGIQVYEGLFKHYHNFEKCEFPADTTVFYSSTFKDVDPKFSATLNSMLFDAKCELNEKLKKAFDDGLISAGNLSKQVLTNLKRILKVGYRSGSFSWKSESIYKMALIKGHISLEEYLRFLTLEGVLEKRSEKAGSGDGFIVAQNFKDAAKNLISNDIVKPELETVIKKILRDFHDL